ncbi:MAG TPA: YihY/virulence factor BrkB family protein [Paenibacillus sp.]|uniref:YihY/virulence factor BrkB family protein n=1 Tax=Paenibacillus sp. TaxID=58172 RepID=UPI0028D5B9F4|nr:YihY/virulence factor BrkB family protein [Paenibacillus sp.]HUC92669.1 YihY/virulence factor BrkB family protein [Paenibacillus sp.]
MIRKQKALQFGQGLIERFRDDEVPALGAQLTYYLLLSFFPFLIFLVSVIGFVQMDGDSVVSDLIRVLPTDTGQTVRDIVNEVTANRSGALLSIGMLATVWAASNGINAVIKGLNKAYDEAETRPFWKVRGISVLATLVLAIVIILAMLMLVFGRAIGEFLFQWLSYPAGFDLIWGIVKYAVPLLAMFAVFMLLYRMTPNRKLTWREVVPGSIFTTVGWIATSLGFSFYVNNFGNYTKTYGSLGGVVVLLIWLYISSIIIVLGGEINATLHFDKAGIRKKPGTRYAFHFPWPKKAADAVNGQSTATTTAAARNRERSGRTPSGSY